MQKHIETNLAFTLIELLVVIAIIGILSGLIITTMSGATESARIAKLKVYSNSVRDTLGANLVSEWKFDEAGTSQTTADTWGTNTGTLGSTNGVNSSDPIWIVSGCPSGNCLSFDGADDYVDCGSGANLRLGDVGDKYTISAWIKTTTTFTDGYIVTNVASSNIQPIRLEVGDKPAILLYDGTHCPVARGLTSVNDGIWHFIAGVIDRTNTLKIYTDGVLQDTKPDTTVGDLRSDLSLNIGRRFNQTGVGFNFNGSIDEVRIYNAAISASQIQQNYLAGLNKLLANNGITQVEYNNRIVELNSNVAEK